MASIPSLTYDQLLEIAEPYEVTVVQQQKDNWFAYELVGKCVTINLTVGKMVETKPRPHRYHVIHGAVCFPHPTLPGVMLHRSAKRSVETTNVEEAFQAALHDMPRPGSSTPTERSYHRLLLYADQNGRCSYCRKAIPLKIASLEHIIPLSRGGVDLPSNWCVACIPCNNNKGNKLPSEYYAQGA